MKTLVKNAALAGALVVGLSAAAEAAITNVTGNIYRFTNSPQNADQSTLNTILGSLGSSTADPNYFVGQLASNSINFFSGGVGTPGLLSTFLAPAGATFTQDGGLVSNAASYTLSAPGFAYATFFDLTFTLTQNAIVSIEHDDGIQLLRDGAVLPDFNSPSPTNEATQTGTLAAGTYRLFYVEANGDPSILRATAENVAVPEPATLAIFGAALAGIGALRRRRS